MKPDRVGITYDLAGWKEIADVLCVSVRTAHRFKMAGMPIDHRTCRHVVGVRERIITWQNARLDRAARPVASRAGEPA